jgi:hypothetical protein
LQLLSQQLRQKVFIFVAEENVLGLQGSEQRRLFSHPDQGCQIFLVHNTKNGKNVPYKLKMHQLVENNTPDSHKVYQHFPI